MTDRITQLLDDVQRLDEHATSGPWTWGDNRDGLGNKLHPTAFPGKYNPIADFEYIDDADAEFIALSRTAMPQLANVIGGLIEHCHNVMSWETPRGHEERIAVESRKQGARAVYKAITDALERELSTG